MISLTFASQLAPLWPLYKAELRTTVLGTF